MSATDVKQNFGQFLDFGNVEPVVIRRQRRDLGVFLPMALYRKLVAAENRKITQAMDKLQSQAAGLSESTLDALLKAENPSWLVVIFDTNVLISAALISGSKADAAVRLVLDRQLPLVFSDATFSELEEVLMRDKFDCYVSPGFRKDLLETWRSAAFFAPSSAFRENVIDCRDASDNKFLELAYATQSKIIVTGDPDLLVLDPWRGVRITALKDFILCRFEL
jgi:putative PIN family toxin of toxin-antitoxin system